MPLPLLLLIPLYFTVKFPKQPTENIPKAVCAFAVGLQFPFKFKMHKFYILDPKERPVEIITYYLKCTRMQKNASEIFKLSLEKTSSPPLLCDFCICVYICNNLFTCCFQTHWRLVESESDSFCVFTTQFRLLDFENLYHSGQTLPKDTMAI